MMCEPQVFGLRAGSSLAKMPSDGRAGGPKLGLDTSLVVFADFHFTEPQGMFLKTMDDGGYDEKGS